MIGLLLLAQLQAFRAEASGNLATADDYIPSTSSAPSWGRTWARTGRPWPRTTPGAHRRVRLVALAALGVFALGFAAGALVMRRRKLIPRGP